MDRIIFQMSYVGFGGDGGDGGLDGGGLGLSIVILYSSLISTGSTGLFEL